jgi:hypothetical protein
MKDKDTINPMWAGFLDLVRSIFAIEIAVYLYYSLAISGEMLP